MVDKTATSNVNVDLRPQGFTQAAKQVQAEIDKIVRSIETTGTVAQQQLKLLSQQLKAAQVLQRAGPQGRAATSQSIQKQAEQVARQAAETRNLGTAVDALRNRYRGLSDTAVKAEGQISKTDARRIRNIQASSKAYNKLAGDISNVRGRIAGLSKEGRTAFAPMIKEIERVDARLAKTFSNPRRFNFNTEIAQSRSVIKGLMERVKVRERIEVRTRRNIEALREEARQILNNSRLEREARLAAAVRTAGTRFRGAELSGQGIYQRDTDQLNRQRRATAALVSTRARLNAELSRPAAQVQAAYVQTLITRERELLRLQGEAIAKQTTLNKQRRGGFFAGLRTGPQNAFNNSAGTDGGGAFGAGALVGRVASYAAAASAVYGVIAALRQAIGFTIEFEDSLAQLQAISGSTATEMERLSSGILQVSERSANSVAELTKSATVIAQAGFAGNEIQNLLQATVNLSAASGSTTDESVDILTSALGAFRLSAGEADRVVNTLVTTLNDSKLSVAQVRLGLQFLGNTAAQNNITFEELTSVLGAMADAGIRSGSTIATGTRQLLVDLIDPSTKVIDELEKIGLTTADIDVKTLGLIEVLKRLRDSGFQAYGTLETRAAAAFVAQSANIDNIEKLLTATERQGVAEEAAATRIDSLAARWQRLLNQMAKTGQLLGTVLIPVLKVLVEVLTGLVRIINGLLEVFGTLIAEIFTLGQAFNSNENLNKAFKQSLADVGVEGEDLMAIMDSLGGEITDNETATKDLVARINDLESREETLGRETDKLRLRQNDLEGSTSAVAATFGQLAARFPELRSEMEGTELSIESLIGAMVRLEDQARRSRIAAAQATLLSTANEISDVNQEAGAVRALVSGNAFDYKRTVINNRSGGDSAALSEFDELSRLIEGRRWTDAINYYNTTRSDAVKDIFEPVIGRIGSFRVQITTAQANQALARDTLSSEQFNLSEAGQTLRNQVGVSRANAARFASQGQEDGGPSRDEIVSSTTSTLNSLAELEKANAGDIGALAVIGAARSSLTSDINKLKPDKPTASEKSAANKAARAAQRRDTQIQRNNARIEKAQAAELRKAFDNALEAVEDSELFAELPDLLAKTGMALDEWLLNEEQAAAAQIITQTGGPGNTDSVFNEQRKEMLATASRKAQEMRLEQINKLADAIEKSINQFLQLATARIEQQFQNTVSGPSQNLAIAQARASGFNNPIGSNNRPAFFGTILQRQAQEAQVALDQATIEARDRQISDLSALIVNAEATKATLEEQLARGGGVDVSIKLNSVEQTLIQLRATTRNLTKDNEALRASYEVLAEAPKTFTEGLNAAIEAVRINLNAADSLGQELIKNLDSPIAALGETFKGFFRDIITGTESLGGAFENMARRIIDSILEMVAVAIANQFFSLILGAVGGAFSPGAATGGGGGGGNPFGGGGGFFRGGPIEKKATGGSIRSGMSTRDSTIVKAAKGEFMMRKAAVDSIGIGALHAMNTQGAQALKGMGGVVAMGGGQPVETNVYLIAPEETPQLGPNDVVAIIARDALQGGVTKKLIKSISTNG